jgi:hypothetical protein
VRFGFGVERDERARADAIRESEIFIPAFKNRMLPPGHC